MSAFDEQIGGGHYKNLKIQPMEYALANDLNYGQANSIKYITRYKHKNGIEDLEKAKHCIDLLIEYEKKKIEDSINHFSKHIISAFDGTKWKHYPETDKFGRIDIIGRNGNDGDHYDTEEK